MAPLSRLRRFEEKRLRKRLIILLAGMVGIVLFLGFFGLKILVGFSLLVDRSGGAATTPTPALLFPPLLDPVPEATNTATIVVSGSAPADTTILVYVDEAEVKNATVKSDGTFRLTGVPLKEGKNQLTAKIRDGQGNTSHATTPVAVEYKEEGPKLEVTAPDGDQTINGGENKYTVRGMVEDQTKVTVNERFVVIRPDGSFTYDINLNEGVNIVKVIATDIAGNTTTIERQVTYFK